MGALDWILLAAVLALLAGAFLLWRKGRSCCGGKGCSGCSGCSACSKGNCPRRNK